MSATITQLRNTKITWGKRTLVLADENVWVFPYAHVLSLTIAGEGALVQLGPEWFLRIDFKSRVEHGPSHVPWLGGNVLVPDPYREQRRAEQERRWSLDMADQREQALAFVRQLHERMEMV